ncbi:hypothetical protein AcW2_001287 [Taiwanofungus camphoratus]|nr:hypothetical protein AcW2_001287 [Antrodia cinnamomea]
MIPFIHHSYQDISSRQRGEMSQGRPWSPSSSITSSSSTPEPLDATRSPTTTVPPTSPSTKARRITRPGHIPRPPNAFMLFRAFLCANLQQARVEHDNRHISRIVGHAWKQLPEDKKKEWYKRAATEKEKHAKLHPGYRFSPVSRAEKPKKRRVKRNGQRDLARCEKVAELLLEGKGGQELEQEVKKIDASLDAAAQAENPQNGTSDPGDYTTIVFDSKTWNCPATAPTTIVNAQESNSAPPFRSPLLPPITDETAAHTVRTPSPLQLPVAQLPIQHMVNSLPTDWTNEFLAPVSDTMDPLLAPEPYYEYFNSFMPMAQPKTQSIDSAPPTFGVAEPQTTLDQIQSLLDSQTDLACTPVSPLVTSNAYENWYQNYHNTTDAPAFMDAFAPTFALSLHPPLSPSNFAAQWEGMCGVSPAANLYNANTVDADMTSNSNPNLDLNLDLPAWLSCSSTNGLNGLQPEPSRSWNSA